MYIKRLLTLVSLVFICYLKGQLIEREGRINPIDHFKTEVYKSIIRSEEFKSNKKCHIIGINSVSLKMDYSIGSPLGNYFYDVQVVKDSISLKELRKDLFDPYWIFEDPYKFLRVEYDMGYISTLKEKDSLYIPQNIDFETDLCKSSFDVIKIYEPLDKWMNFYMKHYSWDYKNMEVVIPVKYESLSKGHMFLEKEKYYLFKIKLGYDDKGRLEIIQEIMK